MPEGVQAKVEKNVITLESSDIELLGHTAASIRNIKKNLSRIRVKGLNIQMK